MLRQTQALPTVMVAATCAIVSPMAHANVDAVVVQPAEMQPAVRFRSAGLPALLSADKDKALRTALALVGPRLSTLHEELPDLEPEQTDAIMLGWEAIAGQISLDVDVAPDMSNVSVHMAMQPYGTRADHFATRLTTLMESTGAPIHRDEGTVVFDTPFGPAYLAVIDGADGGVLTLTLNAEPHGINKPETYDMASGDAVISGMIDFVALGPVLQMALADQDDEVYEMFASMGIVGDHAMRVDMVVAQQGNEAVKVVRLHDRREHWGDMKVFSSGPLDADDLAMIPADATMASAAAVDLSFIGGLIDTAAEMTGEDPFAEIEREIGIDLRTRLVDQLTSPVVVYTADSTGGGGLFSAVSAVGLKDAGSVAGVLGELADKANAYFREELQGYVRIAPFEVDDVQAAWTVTTPGIPIPFEPAVAVAGGRLFFAVTPSGLATAVEHAGDGKLAKSKAFSLATSNALESDGALVLSYFDSPYYVGRGYGISNLFYAAVRNGVRSPSWRGEMPPALAPSYSELVDGVQPMGTSIAWEGDDIVVRMRADRSMLVNIASAAGANSGVGSQVSLLQMGVLLPALGKARQQARLLKSNTQVRAVVQSMIVYANGNEDRLPASTQVLIDEGYLTPELLDSQFGDVGDGLPGLTIRTDLGGHHTTDLDWSTTILVIDRGALLYSRSGMAPVGFLDNHVEVLGPYEIEQLLDMPGNEGAAEALGIADLLGY